MSRITVTSVLFAIVLGSQPARAGIVDTPLPVLDPTKTTLHLYSVPDIVQQAPYGAFFACTSTDSAPITVSVEWFGRFGGDPHNDAVLDALTVAPGATVVFGVYSADWFVADSELGGFPDTKGSARILSTSKRLACSAFIADRGFVGEPVGKPTFPLTIIRKTVQKAAN